MKKIIPNVILIIAFLSIECSSNNKKANADKSEVNNKVALQVLHFPESGEDTLKASYFADTVIYIPLETTKESFFDNIKQVWMNDSVILICCYRAGLLMFQRNGKFVRKIGKDGRGPGEYGLIFNFDVIRDTIYISSSGKRSLLRYTFDGAFCDEVKLNYEPVYFSKTADQKLACYLKEEGIVLVYNKNFYTPDTIVVEYGVTKGRYFYTCGEYAFMKYFQKTPSGLLFSNFLNDTVWNISGNKKEPAFILDTKDKLLPYNEQIEFSKGDFEGWNKIAKAYNLFHIMPLQSCMLIFQKHYLDQEFDAIYLKKNNSMEIKKFTTSGIYDDIVGKQNLYPSFFFSYSGNYLFTYYAGPSKMLKYLGQKKENKKDIPSVSWLNQMKTVKEDDNPILAIIKLKKNL